MSAIGIDFQWGRDAAGYELVLGPMGPLPRKVGLRASSDKVKRIMPRGGELIPYRPFETTDMLYQLFATISTEEQALSFVNRFGPLTQSGNEVGAGEEVGFALAHAKEIRDILTRVANRQPPFRPGYQPNLANVAVNLVADPVTDRVQIRLMPPSLYHALMLQFATSLSQVEAIRQCELCGILFPVGPGTGRSLNSKFCSDAHRIVTNNRNRAKKEKE